MSVTVTELKQQALQLARQSQSLSDALAPLRSQNLEKLDQCAFPEKNTEQWKYTPLLRFVEQQLSQSSAVSTQHDTSWPVFSDWLLVVENGKLNPELSQLPQQHGLHIRKLSEQAINTSEERRTPFGIFNNAALEDGLLIQVEKNTRCEHSLHIVYLNQSEQQGTNQVRSCITLGESSELSVIEHFIGHGPMLANCVTEISAAANSSLTHYRIQDESSDNLQINELAITQQADSRVHSYQLMSGGKLLRNDIHARLQQSGAHLDLKGIFIGRDHQHIDNQVCVEHQAPHCTSDQVFKGMAGEKAQCVFNGRIHIHPGANGTLAELSNKNLLLSNEAEIDSKPELEIYNDDVKCAHGTTVGQIDHTSLFYLQSRGISLKQAKRMLSMGFVNEILNGLPHSALAEWALSWAEKTLDEKAQQDSAGASK